MLRCDKLSRVRISILTLACWFGVVNAASAATITYLDSTRVLRAASETWGPTLGWQTSGPVQEGGDETWGAQGGSGVLSRGGGPLTDYSGQLGTNGFVISGGLVPGRNPSLYGTPRHYTLAGFISIDFMVDEASEVRLSLGKLDLRYYESEFFRLPDGFSFSDASGALDPVQFGVVPPPNDPEFFDTVYLSLEPGVVYTASVGFDVGVGPTGSTESIDSSTALHGWALNLHEKHQTLTMEIVPEPSTGLLVGLGLAALGGRRRSTCAPNRP